MLPHEQAGVLDVVRVEEADERLVARPAGATKGEQRHGALSDAPLAIEQPHPHLPARVAAGVTVLDLPGHRVGGQTP